MVSKRAQDGSKRAQEGATRAPDGSKRAPRGIKTPPRALWTPPGRFPELSRGFPELSRCFQEPNRIAQRALGPEGPQSALRNTCRQHDVRRHFKDVTMKHDASRDLTIQRNASRCIQRMLSGPTTMSGLTRSPWALKSVFNALSRGSETTKKHRKNNENH